MMHNLLFLNGWKFLVKGMIVEITHLKERGIDYMILSFEELIETLRKDDSHLTEDERKNLKETYIHLVNHLPIAEEEKEKLIKGY